MSQGYNIPLVTSLCEISPDVSTMSRAEQVEHLSFVSEADLKDARAFYARNHVTIGMSEFLRGALKRLAGNSQQAVFELRQSMGGGKTHNMIVLGLLARFPELRDQLPTEITTGMSEVPAAIATVNGRDVQNYIYGDIAEQLGKADAYRDRWVNGPKEMTEGDWIQLIGDRPTLIMLDELPPYLDMARTKTLGEGTLLKLLTYSLGNLLTAAMKLKRCVVVISSLDAGYDEARRILGGLFGDLKKEIQRGAKSITPVDLNTGEIYDILRKRLFEKLPDLNGQEVGQVSNAFLATYQEAVLGRAIAGPAEQMAAEISDSYPFHPSYKDILALFKENERFRQTRGLIQFTANLLRGIWNTKSDVFLIGAQFLDFSDQETRDQVKEIERQLESALARDVYDTDGSAHAQEIDGNRKNEYASQVANLLFVSSLSDNTDGIRGLSRETVIEYLVAPGSDPVQFIEAFDSLKERCWYLHRRDGDRWYFSNVANVRKQIEDKIAKVPQDRVDEEMRRRLTDIFFPVIKNIYSEVLVLPSVDDINFTTSKRTCLVLSPDAKSSQSSADRVYQGTNYKNAFCVVTGDGSKMANAENGVRRLLAIAIVRANLGSSPSHDKELEDEQKTAEITFNSTIKSLFNAVWYPHANGLKSTKLDLGHFQENAKIKGEAAVESALSDGGVKKFVIPDPERMTGLIQRCEEQLFPEGQHQTRWVDVLERAASNPRWIWLPPKGLEEIKGTALVEGRWIEKNGYVDKNPPLPCPMIRVNRIGGDEARGESELEIVVSNAGISPEVVASQSRDALDTGEIVMGRIYHTKDAEVWFQVRNQETGEKSEPYLWKGFINITHERRENAGLWYVTLTARPEAEMRWNISQINPKDGEVYDGKPIEIDGSKKTTLSVFANKGSVEQISKFTFDVIGAERKIVDDIPALAKGYYQFATRTEVMRIVRASREKSSIHFAGISITVGERERSLMVRSGSDVFFTGVNLEAAIEGLCESLGEPDAELQLGIREIAFPDGFTLREFSRKTGISIPVAEVEQESG